MLKRDTTIYNVATGLWSHNECRIWFLWKVFGKAEWRRQTEYLNQEFISRNLNCNLAVQFGNLVHICPFWTAFVPILPTHLRFSYKFQCNTIPLVRYPLTSPFLITWCFLPSDSSNCLHVPSMVLGHSRQWSGISGHHQQHRHDDKDKEHCHQPAGTFLHHGLRKVC